MSSNTALAISVGVLGAIATWLFLGPLGGALAIWAAFIAWGCYFHCGGKEQGLQSAILNNAAGAIIAGITLIVATKTGLADTARTAGMGRDLRRRRRRRHGAARQRPDVRHHPGAGLRLCFGRRLHADEGRGAATLTAGSMDNPVVVIILSMIVGAVFGYVSEKLAGMLAGAGHGARHAKA